MRAALLPVILASGLTAVHAADINVRVIVSSDVRPGVYGIVDYGRAPPPPVVYEQPVIVVRRTAPEPVAPLYVHVPPGHAKHWSKHCAKYNACNRPVLFVKSEEYEPGYKPKKAKKERRD